MTTRLDIALKALHQIEEGECGGRYCWRSAGHALAAIDAAPPEIVLTREEAELCAEAFDEALETWERYTAASGSSREADARKLRARIYKTLWPQKEAE